MQEGGEERVAKKEARAARVVVQLGCHRAGIHAMLIERYRLSRRNRCFGMVKLLEEIVHGLAQRVDDGRTCKCCRMAQRALASEGWLYRLANRGSRGRSQSIKRQDEV
jgi:hypothetical protein